MKKGFPAVIIFALACAGSAFGADAPASNNIPFSVNGSAFAQPARPVAADTKAYVIAQAQEPVAPALSATQPAQAAVPSVSSPAPAAPNAAAAPVSSVTAVPKPNSAAETRPEKATLPTGQPLGQPAPGAATDAPLGQSKGGTLEGDVVGKRSNIVHPFASVSTFWTDNVNNSHDNKKSDVGFIASPGIYFALPGMKQKITPITTLNIAPGGATLTGFRPQYPRTLQTYLYYRADIEKFMSSKSLDSISHLVEGVVQYNMRGGLQLQLEDQFNMTHNQRGTGLSTGLDKYWGNLGAISAKYQLGEKSLIRLDYSNYMLHFIGDGNSFRDRTDHKGSAYFFYRLWPRTSLFVQTDYLKSIYKESTVSGSTEYHVFGGVRWDVTDKTRGMLKVGYGIKQFEQSGLGSTGNMYAEAQLDHKFTEKSAILLSASRRTEETDVVGSSQIVANRIEVNFLHRFTTKITGNLNASFVDEQYRGPVTIGGVNKELHDQYVRAGASVLYEYRDWLAMTLGYYFTDRMSNFNSLSYITNAAFFRVSVIF